MMLTSSLYDYNVGTIKITGEGDNAAVRQAEERNKEVFVNQKTKKYYVIH